MVSSVTQPGKTAAQSAWKGLLWVWSTATLLTLAGAADVTETARTEFPQPRLTMIPPPPGMAPGQPLSLRLHWDLPETAEVETLPVGDVPGALLQWRPASRIGEAIVWDGTLVPLRPGPVSGAFVCTAAIPILPRSQPGSATIRAPSRFLVNLYAPCRYELVTGSVRLPAIAVPALPDLPPGMPPFTGLLGLWHGTLAASPPSVVLHQPFEITWVLNGHGSRACFRPPRLAHPDIEVGAPQVDGDEGTEVLRVRWDAVARRLPLTAILLACSTFNGVVYVPHRLTLDLRVQPEDPTRADAAPTPALLRFHPLPSGPGAAARSRASVGGVVALLGLTAAAGLVCAARRRDHRRTPAGRRQSARDRLRSLRPCPPEDIPRLYQDLGDWLGLSPGVSAQDIEVALRPLSPALADEVHTLEGQRFLPSGRSQPDSARLVALLKRLPCVIVLMATLALPAAPTDPGAGLRAQTAETAFRQRDFARACSALMAEREQTGESPELLMNLANACWFSGRHIEALALYERAARLAPRRPEIGEALGWLRARLLAGSPGLDAHYPQPIRDRLRPDEWICLAGVLAGFGSLAAGLLRWQRRRLSFALLPTGLAVLVCLYCAFSQWTGPYRPGATARLSQTQVLRTAPAETAVPAGGPLPAGSLVIPVDEQTGWVLVRTPALEGWVPATHCLAVW